MYISFGSLVSVIRTFLFSADAAAARTSIGLGTGDSPQLTAVNVGHASDTTLERISAGVVGIEGNLIYHAGGVKPLVILASGQSNFNGTPAYTWTANPRSFLWDGDSFEQIDGSTEINAAWRFASGLADEDPLAKVYLINVPGPGLGIDAWLGGSPPPDPDMYADIVTNVEDALGVLGLDKIDGMIWWQGESDLTTRSTYAARFEQLVTALKGETWFPVNTPMMIFGVTELLTDFESVAVHFNSILAKIVAADPDHRSFVRPAAFPAEYWDESIAYLHMTPEGYDLVGGMAAREWFNGTGHNIATARALVEGATGVGDANYAILPTDRFVYTTAAFTASRSWTLPSASQVNPGTEITIADLQSAVSGSNTLTVSRIGSDVISGSTSVTLARGRQGLKFTSDGGARWHYEPIYTGIERNLSAGLGNTRGGVITNRGSSQLWESLTPGTAELPLVSKGAGADLVYQALASTGIADDAVTNAKLANMAANTIKGRVTGSTGDPEDLTAAQALTVIEGAHTVNVQDFSASGTWTKPSGAKRVHIQMWGGGGGGSGGARVASGNACSGGGGGGGAGHVDAWVEAADLNTTEAVTIAAGGNGGAGATSDGVAGSNGTAGGNSTFKGFTAFGGGRGTGGQLAGNSGGGAGACWALVGLNASGGTGGAQFLGGAGGGSGGNGANSINTEAGAGGAGSLNGGVGGISGGTPKAGGGGGGGGGVSVTPAAFNGGAGGGTMGAAPITGGAGGTSAAAGDPGPTPTCGGGFGGGGGASNIAGVGGAGGAGSVRGGAGGGGGSAIGGNGGAGGGGGGGFCRVTTYF